MAFTSQQSVLEEAGLVTRELGGRVTGATDGVNKAFVVEHKPLADNNYDDTIGKEDVVAYVNGEVAEVDDITDVSGRVTLKTAPTEHAVVTVDYSYSAVSQHSIEEVVAEAEDWISTELREVVTIDSDNLPPTLRTCTRLYAAGLLMIRYYSMQQNDEQETAGYGKIKLAKKLLADYRERLIANGEDAGESGVLSVTSEGNLFQRYNSAEGRWGSLRDETFTINQELEQ